MTSISSTTCSYLATQFGFLGLFFLPSILGLASLALERRGQEVVAAGPGPPYVLGTGDYPCNSKCSKGLRRLGTITFQMDNSLL